ncbi:MAG: tRNA modification GTPase trmE [Phycisphaerales bacterium]|nr:tRNA modification GTPase trmE [Phycisphaerales bacterium]
MVADDTIVAVSSASGSAARMIVRTSGSDAVDVGRAIAPELPTDGGTAARAVLAFAGLVCPAWVYVFRGPRSYTGEDLVEYHLPGNPVLAGLLLRHLQHLGLRPAEPGEFTARAYFRGRLDLTAAEGVAATIAANSADELAAARGLMAGELARRLAGPADRLLETLALLEVGIDFSDEDVTVLSPAELSARVTACRDDLRRLLAETDRSRPAGGAPAFVLAGRPNAGKSTLLNALAGYARAVASATAGTTRDPLAADVPLARGLVRVIDVAGLESVAPGPGAPGAATSGEEAAAEVAGRMRAGAERAIAEADFVLLLTPFDEPHDLPDLGRPYDLLLQTQTDRRPAPIPIQRPTGTGPGSGVSSGAVSGGSAMTISAFTGDGMDRLREVMDELAFGRRGSGHHLALNARHVEALRVAAEAMDRVLDLTAMGGGAELASAELRAATDAVGGVLGRVSPDELLGRIFSRFCIGK